MPHVRPLPLNVSSKKSRAPLEMCRSMFTPRPDDPPEVSNSRAGRAQTAPVLSFSSDSRLKKIMPGYGYGFGIARRLVDGVEEEEEGQIGPLPSPFPRLPGPTSRPVRPRPGSATPPCREKKAYAQTCLAAVSAARHTFASHLVMKGVPPKAVQELMGHATIEMTSEPGGGA